MKFTLERLLGALAFVAGITIVTGGSEQYADLVKIHGLLRTADDRLVQMSTKSCQTGSGSIQFCSFDLSLTAIFNCLQQTALNPETRQVEIYFDRPFVTTPSVAVLISGFKYLFATAFNISAARVTPAALTVQATGLFTPGSLSFNYIACDQAVIFPKAYLDIQEQIAFYGDI